MTQLINIAKPLKRGEVKINNDSLYDKRIVLAKRPSISSPSPQLDIHTANGINGFVPVFHGGYGERQGEFTFSVMSQSETDREDKKSYLYSLFGKTLTIQAFNDPYGTYTGYLQDVKIEESHALNYSFIAECEFTLQPYRALFYRVEGEGNTITFDKGILMPTIKITNASNTVELTVNDETMKFNNLPRVETLVVDFENKRVTDGRNGLSQYKVTKGYPQWRAPKVTYSTSNTNTIDYNWRAI